MEASEGTRKEEATRYAYECLLHLKKHQIEEDSSPLYNFTDYLEARIDSDLAIKYPEFAHKGFAKDIVSSDSLPDDLQKDFNKWCSAARYRSNLAGFDLYVGIAKERASVTKFADLESSLQRKQKELLERYPYSLGHQEMVCRAFAFAVDPKRRSAGTQSYPDARLVSLQNQFKEEAKHLQQRENAWKEALSSGTIPL